MCEIEVLQEEEFKLMNIKESLARQIFGRIICYFIVNRCDVQNRIVS